MSTTVEHDDTQAIKNNRAVTVDGTHTETIKKDTLISITEGNYTHKVSVGAETREVMGKVTETFHDSQETIVTQSITIKSQGSFIHVTAATDIILQVGASKLALYSDGRIELRGVSLAINGSTAVNISGTSITSEASADHNVKGAIVLSEGSATNTVKGGMVMLNP